MSALSTRLKRRAKVLAAGLALSAATLATLPGVAEAKGGEHNANQARGSIGAATAQDGIDVKGNNAHLNPQVAVGHASNEAKNGQRAGDGSTSGGSAANERNNNDTSGSILAGTVQAGVDLNRNNLNAGPQVSALGNSNEANTRQNGGDPGSGSSANDERNGNQTEGSIGTLTAQDLLGVEGNNLNAAPQISALDDSNEADTGQQTGGSGGSADDERNGNETGGSVGTVTLQDVLNLDGNNTNVGLGSQVSVLDGSETEQNGGGDLGDSGPDGGEPQDGGGGSGDGGSGGSGPDDTGGDAAPDGGDATLDTDAGTSVGGDVGTALDENTVDNSTTVTEEVIVGDQPQLNGTVDKTKANREILSRLRSQNQSVAMLIVLHERKEEAQR